jgi:acyl CoA:acetate/3-ketoacid CoA transferase
LQPSALASDPKGGFISRAFQMGFPSILTAAQAAGLIPDGATVTVSSSSGLGCPDAVLAAVGRRFGESGHPRRLTTLHPIAAGDMYGIKGIDHIAKEGLLTRVLAGSYPSGPSSAEPPAIWRMISGNAIQAYNIPSGILFDMHREAAAKRPGVITKIGLDTFVDPDRGGCAMNALAAAEPVVSRIDFANDTWLFFPSVIPNIAIIRATTADERGNLSFEHEGAYLGPLDQALAVRNNGGIVIAQVKRLARSGTLKPQHVRVPGILVDAIVVAPDQMQTTQTSYDPAISGEVFRPRSSFSVPEFGIPKVIARRVARELRHGDAVNIGFGISANVPRILLEEGCDGDVTWVIEQGAVGGVPLLDFQFGCAANAEAIMPSPYQFTYFQGGGFDASLLSFLEIDRHGSVNVSRLGVCPHVTAGAGGFVDITARARKIVFSGFFAAGAKLDLNEGAVAIRKEGKVRKLVKAVEQVSFSGPRAVAQGQQVTYVTERCVMQLTHDGIAVTEIAPGVDLDRDVLKQADFPLLVPHPPQVMDRALFRPEPMGLVLERASA